MPIIAWTNSGGTSLDRCELSDGPQGFRLAGTALLVHDGTPYELRYTVLTAPDWTTRNVGVHVQGPEADRRLALSADGGGAWMVGDNPLLDLFGPLDVDLAWTPATNTLAIRRLGLEAGDSAEVEVVYVDFPAHDIVKRTQTYERLDEVRYRYTAGTFSTILVTDDHGLVTEYPGQFTVAG